MNKIDLSVVIVNYNGEKFLPDCIQSLKLQLQDLNYEIVIVDNLSNDNSVAYIKFNYPEIVLIESKENLGFGKGNNLGVEHAKGEFILLFNNDTILLTPVTPGLNLLRNDASIGVIGANMFNGNKEYTYACGYFPNALNMLIFKKFLMHQGEFANGNFTKKTYEVDWMSGSFLLLKKQVYLEINGFDPDYFMYVEDVDICKKIADKQLKRIFMPELKYIHYVGFDPKKNPLIINGYRIYIKKHFGFVKQIILNISLSITKVVKHFKYQ